MSQHKVSTDIALLIFLAMIVAAIIFPVLGNVPLSEEELAIAERIGSGVGAGSIAGIFGSENNIFVEAYTHAVLLLHGLLPMLGKAFELRLPGALTVMVLTLCLFRFGGSIDRYNSSFLASLLFLSSALVMRFTFNASEVVLPAALFIFALMSLYHWLHHRGKHTFWLVVFSTSVATVLIGATAPISIAIMAYAFLLAARRREVGRFVAITVALLLACCVAFMMLYVIVGDTSIALAIFDIRQQLAVSPGSSLYVFADYILFAVFPWSIPLIISLPWMVRNPGEVYRGFLGLTLLQRYSIIVFLFSLPFFFFVTDLTVVLLIASMFFNMPLIGRYLLMQSGRHSRVWKVSGCIFAALVAAFVTVFAVVTSGMPLTVGGCRVALSGGNAWSIVLVVVAYLGIYTLWRNARSIGENNRFLYNLIFLYITSAIICVGFVIGNLSITWL